LRDFALDIARAAGFLSRLPLPHRFFVGYDGSLTRVARALPVAGALITLPSAFLLVLLLLLGTEPLLATLVALTLQIFLTGALHEDGLADCADGLGGGKDKERALEIMKDSRLGAYGGLALVLSVALRVSAISAIVTASGVMAAGTCLVATAALSRAALVWHWTTLPPAKPTGVAALAGAPDANARNIAIVSGLLIFALLALAGAGLKATVAAIILASLAIAIFTRLTRKKIEGHTGDTLGASQQVVEIVTLLALAIAA
jgi:adenosylcobinamide-GDP ribazoletransferase